MSNETALFLTVLCLMALLLFQGSVSHRRYVGRHRWMMQANEMRKERDDWKEKYESLDRKQKLATGELKVPAAGDAGQPAKPKRRRKSKSRR